MLERNSVTSNTIYDKEVFRPQVDKCFDAIHNIIAPVFGPYAINAWISKDNTPYFTRDGKEIFSSVFVDDDIFRYVQQILYQAVENQARIVGDGTTTLVVLYYHLYNQLRNLYDRQSSLGQSVNIHEFKKTYSSIIEEIGRHIDSRSIPLTTNDQIISLFMTCTQDDKLVKTLIADERILEAIKEGSSIIVNKSNMPTDINVSVSQYPTINAKCVYSSDPNYSDNGTIPNACTFFVNGAMDICSEATFSHMATMAVGDIRPNIVFIAGSVTDRTRRTLRAYDEYVKRVTSKYPNSKFNNIYIFTIDKFMNYEREEINDIVAYIYNDPEVSGMQGVVEFESYLYQTFSPNTDECKNDEAYETLTTLNLDIKHITTLKSTFCNLQEIEYTYADGIKFSRPGGEASEKRKAELMKLIDDEKSMVTREKYIQRLKKLYGKYIEIEVGSKLLKDGQNKFELVLDAIISSTNAQKNGIIKNNSLYHVLDILTNYMAPTAMKTTQSLEREIIAALQNAVCNTLADIISNKYPSKAISDINRDIVLALEYLEKYRRGDLEEENEELECNFDITREYDHIFNYPPTNNESGVTVNYPTVVVESAMSIKNILNMSDIIIDIVWAKVFGMPKLYGII